MLLLLKFALHLVIWVWLRSENKSITFKVMFEPASVYLLSPRLLIKHLSLAKTHTRFRMWKMCSGLVKPKVELFWI